MTKFRSIQECRGRTQKAIKMSKDKLVFSFKKIE